MTIGSLKMISRISQLALVLFAVVAGCAGEGQSGDTQSAIRAEELPQVGGCETVVQPLRALRVRPVDGVVDLFVVHSGERAVCIDSHSGVQEMLLRVNPHANHEEAGSNPMPGDSASDVSSNPMPGDPGSGANAGSNPMPGENHKH
jgi:hypothetical protein